MSNSKIPGGGFEFVMRNFTCGTLHATPVNCRNLWWFVIWHPGILQGGKPYKTIGNGWFGELTAGFCARKAAGVNNFRCETFVAKLSLRNFRCDSKPPPGVAIHMIRHIAQNAVLLMVFKLFQDFPPPGVLPPGVVDPPKRCFTNGFPAFWHRRGKLQGGES